MSEEDVSRTPSDSSPKDDEASAQNQGESRRMSTSKEDSKRRIQDQANRVRNIFSIAASDDRQPTTLKRPQEHAFPPHAALGWPSRSNSMLSPGQSPPDASGGAAIPFNTSNKAVATSDSARGVTDIDSGSLKKRRLDPTSPTPRHSPSYSVDSGFDPSIFDEVRESSLSWLSQNAEGGDRSNLTISPVAKASSSQFLASGHISDEIYRHATKPRGRSFSEHQQRLDTSQWKKQSSIESPPNVTRVHAPRAQVPQKLRLNYPPYQELTLNNNDVICNQHGALADSQVGNRRFFVLLDLHLESYRRATSTVEHFGIARKIVNAIREAIPPGRFIFADHSTGLCSVAKEDAATRTTALALREKLGHRPVIGRLA